MNVVRRHLGIFWILSTVSAVPVVICALVIFVGERYTIVPNKKCWNVQCVMRQKDFFHSKTVDICFVSNASIEWFTGEIRVLRKRNPVQCVDDSIRILEDVGIFTFDDGTDEGDAADLKKGRILFCKFEQFKGLLESSEEGGTPRAELL